MTVMKLLCAHQKYNMPVVGCIPFVSIAQRRQAWSALVNVYLGKFLNGLAKCVENKDFIVSRETGKEMRGAVQGRTCSTPVRFLKISVTASTITHNL
jgi:hypothetical protein